VLVCFNFARARARQADDDGAKQLRGADAERGRRGALAASWDAKSA
jgi:hypothetical protein